jgi:hypothetical protein
MARGVVLGAALLLAMVGPASAQSAGERVSLRWSAPDECPDDAHLIASVERLLGQPLGESREQRLSIAISVQGKPGGYSAKLSFVWPSGNEQRFLEHPECAALTEAAALLAALAIDPERVRARQDATSGEMPAAPSPVAPEPAPSPAQSEPPPTAPPPAPCPPARPAPPPPKQGLRGSLSALGFLGLGPLPGAVPGVAAEVGLGRGPLRAALVGRYWAPATSDPAPGGTATVELSLITAGLRGCILPLASDWILLGCVGADWGDMSGSGQGVDNAHTRHDTFAAIEASFSLAYARAETQPLFGLGLVLPVLRPPFGVQQADEEQQVFQPNQVGVVAFLGLAHGL